MASSLKLDCMTVFQFTIGNLSIHESRIYKNLSNIYLTLCRNYYTIIMGGGTMGKNLRIKTARAAKDMTQKDLADAVGVARQTMNAIEKGDYNPSIKLCITICKVLGKTLDQLFWEDDEYDKQ